MKSQVKQKVWLIITISFQQQQKKKIFFDLTEKDKTNKIMTILGVMLTGPEKTSDGFDMQVRI